MKKQSYFQTFYGRRNIVQDLFLAVFTSIASYPKLLLEVFCRKNVGRRYINIASIITTLVIFSWIPSITYQVGRFTGTGHTCFWRAYASWYLFLAAFLFMSILRWRETHMKPLDYDVMQFTFSTGTIHPFFFKLPFLKTEPSKKMIETVYEPALFFLIGLFLKLCAQPVGVLLMVCSIIYALAYVAAYNKGQNYILDHFDDRACNQELHQVMTKGYHSEQSRNVPVFFDVPNDSHLSQQVADRVFPIDGDWNTEAV